MNESGIHAVGSNKLIVSGLKQSAWRRTLCMFEGASFFQTIATPLTTWPECWSQSAICFSWERNWKVLVSLNNNDLRAWDCKTARLATLATSIPEDRESTVQTALLRSVCRRWSPIPRSWMCCSEDLWSRAPRKENQYQTPQTPPCCFLLSGVDLAFLSIS